MNIKTIFFVPARSGSQRIPHKNLSKIGNFSLITIALLKCIKISALNSKVILSTDYSEEELDLPSQVIDNISVHQRSSNVSGSSSRTEDVVIEYLKQNPDDQNSIIVLVQCTSPFLSSSSLHQGLTQFKLASDISISIIAAYPYKSFQWMQNKTGYLQPKSYDPFNRQKTQDMPTYYQECGAFYISHASAYLKGDNRLSSKVLACPINLLESLDIDTPDDLLLAQKIGYNGNPDFANTD